MPWGRYGQLLGFQRKVGFSWNLRVPEVSDILRKVTEGSVHIAFRFHQIIPRISRRKGMDIFMGLSVIFSSVCRFKFYFSSRDGEVLL